MRHIPKAGFRPNIFIVCRCNASFYLQLYTRGPFPRYLLSFGLSVAVKLWHCVGDQSIFEAVSDSSRSHCTTLAEEYLPVKRPSWVRLADSVSTAGTPMCCLLIRACWTLSCDSFISDLRLYSSTVCNIWCATPQQEHLAHYCSVARPAGKVLRAC